MGGKEQKLSGLSRRPLGMRRQSRLTVVWLLIADILVVGIGRGNQLARSLLFRVFWELTMVALVCLISFLRRSHSFVPL